MNDSEALSNLEQAAASTWALVEDFTTLFAEHENAQDDTVRQLQAMRTSYTSSLQLLLRLQALERTMSGRINQLAQGIGQFEKHISRTALNYGLNVLPDDVLSEIFVIAAVSLKEKVALSLVCKRFRSVMMSMRKMWARYWIETRQSPEQIIAVAEGNGFASLKARIYTPSNGPSCVKTWVDERGLDLEEYLLRYHKFSVGLILSFGPEELREGEHLDASVWKEIEPILAGGNTQNLRSLVMPGIFRNSAGARFLESWHMPLLQNLEVGFVPGAALGRDLVRCSLFRIAEAEFDSLREFLAAAKSLQDLRLCLSSNTRLLYEVCDLPSVRSLEVNFDPHPSLATHLVRFRLFLSQSRDISLSGLLKFLSMSEMLQELDTFEDLWSSHGFSEGRGAIDALPVLTMRSVLSCQLLSYKMGATLVAKLHMPNLRTLTLYLDRYEGWSTITRNEFRTSLQSMSSLEVLELSGEVGSKDVAEIIRYAPPHLDTLSLKECRFFATGAPQWNTAHAPNRNLIHFKDCGNFEGIPSTFISYLGHHLKAVGLGRVKIQFDNCVGRTNGTFGLDDVIRADLNKKLSRQL